MDSNNVTNLKVLMISSDRNVTTFTSAVAERMKEYAALVGELHIIVLSDKSHGLESMELSKNCWVYPTDSSSKFMRPRDAAALGKRLVYEKGFTRGRSLITADSIECGWAGMKIKRKWRIPLEVQLHTDPFSPFYSGFQNWVRKFLARTVLAKADSVRVVSEDLKSQISNLKINAHVYVLPIYIEKEKFENIHPTFDLHTLYLWQFVLLTVSRLTPEKQIGRALEALALVRQKYPNTGLVIVGSGSEEEVLRSKIRSLKLEGHVEFAGWQTDLASYYKTANAFLQTSTFEGYGLSLVEAGLAGLPVITTNVGVAAELEDRRDAYVYPVGRLDLIAEGIVELIESNQKRENLKFNLKQTLEKKLISKEEYLNILKEEWYKVAQKMS